MTLSHKVIGFKVLKKVYVDDDDFKDIWIACQGGSPKDDFHIHDDYLIRGDHLCICQISLCQLLIRDLYCGGFNRHLGLIRLPLA